MNTDDAVFPRCCICQVEMESKECDECEGEGGFHDCGEDCCCCEDPDELNDECPQCRGSGYYWQCPAIPHTDEQMAAWRMKGGS